MDLTFGIDVSRWQTNLDYTKQPFFNPAVAKEKGVNFAFIKATEGVYTDPAVEKFQSTFREAGILRGFYHFARYAPYSSTTASKQAEYFWNVVKDFSAELPPVLDLEDRTLIGGNGIGMSWIKLFLTTLESLSGVTPILYTSHGYYNNIAKSNETVSEWITKYPLWIANYIPTSILPAVTIYEDTKELIAIRAATKPPTTPSIFKGKWRFWQYSQVGDGYHYGGKYGFTQQTGLDMNVYQGTLSELMAEFNIGGEIPNPPDPPVPTNKYVRVIARDSDGNPGWLYFRDSPTFDYKEQLAVGHNEIFELLSPSPINGLWHVRTARGREGYLSAGSAWTELIN